MLATEKNLKFDLCVLFMTQEARAALLYVHHNALHGIFTKLQNTVTNNYNYLCNRVRIFASKDRHRERRD